MTEQSLQTIRTAIHKQVGTVTLNRPEAMNALNQRMMREVSDTILEWDDSDNVRAIVLTGSEKAFAAGADIKEMMDQQYLDALQQNFLNDWTCIAACRTPTIAAVGGYALGGGCEIAMMCDILLAADNASFGQPEIKIGTMPGLGGTQRLSRRIGTAKAMELCLTGRMMDAHEAEIAGLVSRVVPLNDLLAEAQSTGERIASYSAAAVTLVKEAISASDSTTLEQGLLLERRGFYSLFGTEDQQEGMRAFAEKRKPEFSR